MIFSEKNIYKKLVCYTGTLTKGRMSLTPLIKIVGLLSLIDRYAGYGFPLKSIVPQDIQHNSFQDTQPSNYIPPPEGGARSKMGPVAF